MGLMKSLPEAIAEPEHRAIPLEVLRVFYRDAVEAESIRTVAAECDVGHSTLQKFVTGETTTPHPRIRRLLALHYLRSQGGAADRHHERDALDFVLPGLPGRMRDQAAAQIRDVVQRTYESAGLPPPEWVGSGEGTPRATGGERC